jgi:hypothetical protein
MYSLKSEDLLFYDIECFQEDSLVVFKDINDNEVAHFWYDHSKQYPADEGNGFQDIPALCSGKTLVGYNNYYYDDIMLTVMTRGSAQKLIYLRNKQLISGAKTYIDIPDWLHSIDCFQQIDVAKPSLKVIEGNLGLDIRESKVSFDKVGRLSEEEKAEVLEYCRYDVSATIKVFKLRLKSYFETKAQLIDMIGSDKGIRWNTTSLSAQYLLGGEVLSRWTTLRIPEDKWRNVEGIPDDLWDKWKLAEPRDAELLIQDEDGTEKDFSKLKYKYRIYDCDFVFGMGGLHGVAVNEKEFGQVKLLDVGSMYPSIIILLEALGEHTVTYDQIRKDRLAIKHVDKVKSNALKLILNSVYGNMKNKYSTLNNPMAATTVCIYGQIALFDLCRMLYQAGYKLINVNTDGVAFNGGNDEDWKDIQKEWEENWGLYLELDEFDHWWQKDVNNYIATQGEHVKVKGGETNKYYFDPDKGVHKLFSNNNIRIVQMGLVNKIVKNIDPMDTILEHLNEPELFMYILKAGHTYEGACDAGGQLLDTRVNRVFAVKSSVPHTKLYKKRPDGGLVNYPDAPECMYVWNEDVHKLKDFGQIVDIDHYYQIIWQKLEMWGIYS